MPTQVRFLLGRLVTYGLVILCGVTFIFFIPRFLPVNPVEAMLGKVLSQGTYMEQAQIDRETARSEQSDMFGQGRLVGRKCRCSFNRRHGSFQLQDRGAIRIVDAQCGFPMTDHQVREGVARLGQCVDR